MPILQARLAEKPVKRTPTIAPDEIRGQHSGRLLRKAEHAGVVYMSLTRQHEGADHARQLPNGVLRNPVALGL
eukprot:14538386-Alexandrium_andersonii.AAC.1